MAAHRMRRAIKETSPPAEAGGRSGANDAVSGALVGDREGQEHRVDGMDDAVGGRDIGLDEIHRLAGAVRDDAARLEEERIQQRPYPARIQDVRTISPTLRHVILQHGIHQFGRQLQAIFGGGGKQRAERGVGGREDGVLLALGQRVENSVISGYQADQGRKLAGVWSGRVDGDSDLDEVRAFRRFRARL